MANDNNTNSGKITRIVILSMLDPIAFLLSILITYMVMLHAWNSSILHIFSIFETANLMNSISDILVIFIPITAIMSLNVLFHLFRNSIHIQRMLVTYFCFIFSAVVMIVLLVQIMLLWTEFFDQSTAITDAKLAVVAWLVVTSLVLTFGIAFALSVRSELNAICEKI